MANKIKNGRPTKYCKEIVEKASEYLKTFEELGDKIPSVEGLSLFIEITRSTIYEWAQQEDKEDFSDILEKINATQKQVLINKGLSGDFNSAIAKLVLGVHGLSEKHFQEVAGVEGRPLITKIERVIIAKK